MRDQAEPLTLPRYEGIRPAAESRSVLTETTSLVALSVLSPATGLAVEMALAWRFGTSPLVDAYRVTVLLILFGQQLFVTAILPFVIVPIFAEYRKHGKVENAWAAADSLAYLLLGFGALIALLLFVYPGSATNLLAPGLVGESRSTAVFFVRWCSLAFIPLCWSGVACGILYAHEVFRVAPLSQLLYNVILLLAIVLLGAKLGSASVVLGVVLGATGSACLFAFRLALVRRRFAPRRATTGIDLPALRRILRLATPLIAGILVGQLSGAIVTRTLSRLPTGNLAAFGYSWKLGQIVLLTPSALSTVLFPKLSAIWHSAGRREFTASYVKALRATYFITVPLTCVTYALRAPIIAFLLQRGAFSDSAARLTTALFGALILGAPGGAMGTYLDRMFYATQETTIPVAVDIGCALVAISLVPLLAVRFGVYGVASLYMILPWLACVALLALCRGRHGGDPFKGLLGFALKIAIIAAASAWLAAKLGGMVAGLIGTGAISLAAGLVSGAGLAVFVFVAVTSFLKLPEAIATRAHMRRYLCFNRDAPNGDTFL